MKKPQTVRVLAIVMLCLFLGTILVPSISASNPLSESHYGNTYMFTGQRYDPKNELYHFYARSYSPELGGRWLQRDPLGYVDGMNLYEYVRGNPMRYVDPLGLQSNNALIQLIEKLNKYGDECILAGKFDEAYKASRASRGVQTLLELRGTVEMHAILESYFEHAIKDLGDFFAAKLARLGMNNLENDFIRKLDDFVKGAKRAAKTGKTAAQRGSNKIPGIGIAIFILAELAWPSESFAELANIATWPLPAEWFFPDEMFKEISPEELKIITKIEKARSNAKRLSSLPHISGGDFLEYTEEEVIAPLLEQLETLRAHKTAENQGNSGSSSGPPCGGGSGPEIVDVNGNGLD